MTQINELSAKIDAINAQLTKASAEIITEVQNLHDAITSNGVAELPADAETSLAKLSAIAQALDDLNPDVQAATGVAG